MTVQYKLTPAGCAVMGQWLRRLLDSPKGDKVRALCTQMGFDPDERVRELLEAGRKAGVIDEVES